MCYYDYAVHLADQAAARYDFAYDHADGFEAIDDAEQVIKRLDGHEIYDQVVFNYGGDEPFQPSALKQLLVEITEAIKYLDKYAQDLEDYGVEDLTDSLVESYQEIRAALMRGRAEVARGTLLAMETAKTPVFDEF